MKTTFFSLLVSFISLSIISCEKGDGLQSIPPEQSISEPLPLAISSSVCILEGESLIVYNSETQDFEAYNSDTYVVEWNVGFEQVSTGYRIECVCGKTFSVVVTDIDAGISAQMEYTAFDCGSE